MIELSRKKVLDLANTLNAIDVTHDQREREGYKDWNLIAYSFGLYGPSSKLFFNHKTNRFYVVKARTSAIFMYD